MVDLPSFISYTLSGLILLAVGQVLRNQKRHARSHRRLELRMARLEQHSHLEPLKFESDD